MWRRQMITVLLFLVYSLPLANYQKFKRIMKYVKSLWRSFDRRRTYAESERQQR